ncbi:MAG: D-glycerate dehydrogenase [Verrucomicrobiales bacterium]|nr:D-glycerate dehydrogenase [Verrucomicrobiales bacterium]
MSEPLPKVLFTLNAPEDHLAPLRELAEVRILENGFSAASREVTLREIRDCTVVISQGELRVDKELLDAAPHLRMVANVAMGIDNLDLEELQKRNIIATNTPAAFAESTADLTMGLLLALTRRIAESDRFVRTGEWAGGMEPLRWEGMQIGGKTLGIIGYGRIAKLVEQRALAFGMKVIHTRSRVTGHENERTLDGLLGEADIVVVLVPLTKQTTHLINRDRLARMKPGALFINVARGKVMDETAVVEALQSGHLSGAAFDVFENEPVVNEALFPMDNVVLTPHIGGATREQRKAGRLEAAGEVARFLRGEKLVSQVC